MSFASVILGLVLHLGKNYWYSWGDLLRSVRFIRV